MGVPFATSSSLTKAFEENGSKYLCVVASDTGPDLHKGVDKASGQNWVAERVTPRFLQKMVETAGAGEVELNSGHPSAMPLAWSVGVATEKQLAEWGIGDNGYDVFAPIFKIEEASADGQQLWSMAKDGKRERQFSIGGNITEAFVKWDQTAGGMCKFIDDGAINHVAVTRPNEAAMPRTGFAHAMAKALTDAGLNWEDLRNTRADWSVDTADQIAKAWVDSMGDIHLSSYDITDARVDGVYAGSPDFAANLRAMQVRENGPVLTELLFSTIGRILRDDEVSDKGTAMRKAVTDFDDSMVTLVETGRITKSAYTHAIGTVATAMGEPGTQPSISKTTEAIEGQRSLVGNNSDGGALMGKVWTEQERTIVGALLNKDVAGLADDEITNDVTELDEEQREALAKFMPLPALEGADVAYVKRGLRAFTQNPDGTLLGKDLLEFGMRMGALQKQTEFLQAQVDALTKTGAPAAAAPAVAPVADNAAEPVAAAPAAADPAVPAAAPEAVPVAKTIDGTAGAVGDDADVVTKGDMKAAIAAINKGLATGAPAEPADADPASELEKGLASLGAGEITPKAAFDTILGPDGLKSVGFTGQ